MSRRHDYSWVQLVNMPNANPLTLWRHVSPADIRSGTVALIRRALEAEEQDPVGTLTEALNGNSAAAVALAKVRATDPETPDIAGSLLVLAWKDGDRLAPLLIAGLLAEEIQYLLEDRTQMRPGDLAIAGLRKLACEWLTLADVDALWRRPSDASLAAKEHATWSTQARGEPTRLVLLSRFLIQGIATAGMS